MPAGGERFTIAPAMAPPEPIRPLRGGALTLLETYNGTGYEDYHHECSHVRTDRDGLITSFTIA